MQPGPRNEALDIVKGVLVILMVVYHVMSIASLAEPEQFRYIRFISGSFILIAGYVLTRFARVPSLKTSWRGAKLLALFTVLNLVIHTTGFGNASKAQLGMGGYASRLVDIYLRGDGRLASFIILLPIAYLLMLSPLFIAAAKRVPVWFIVGGMAIVLGLAALPGFADDSAILELAWVGIFGLMFGCLSYASRIEAWLGELPLPAAIGLLAVSIWISGNIGYSVFAYTVGICAVLAGIYSVALKIATEAPAHAWLVRLGQYSLFAYITQIVVIQLAFRALGGTRLEPGLALVCLILVTAILTLLACHAVERSRRRHTPIDRLYRAVFA